MQNLNKLIKILFIFLLCIVIIKVQAQTGLNFQGVARTTNNIILASQPISLRLSILQGSSTGVAEYVETRRVTTNAQGLFIAVIGDTGAISTLGNFSTINWKNTPKFLKIEMDPAAGNNFISMGTTQFQYVAYAQFANSVDAENITGVVPVARGGTGANSLSTFKTTMALDKVNNTADTEKPISAKTQTALDLKLNAEDSNKYVKKIWTDSALLTKLNSSDTIKYVKKTYADSSLLTKLKITDTASMLSNRIGKDTLSLSNRINLKANLADTIKYTKQIYTDSSLLTKLRITDTADMLSNRIGKDTLNLSARINAKANNTDVTTSLALKENASNKSSAADLGGSSPSDILYPTQKAVKEYVTANASSGGVADGGITTIKLADGAVTDAKLGTGISKSKVGLGNVENVSISTWAGTSSLTTVGTITSGIWSSTAISLNNGGTGASNAAAARANLGLVIGTNVQAPLTAGTSYIVPNSSITGATKTKITFDTKGLITAGADATTADIAPSSDRNYVTDVQSGVISNTSGINTGDETTATIKSKLGISILSGFNTGDQTITLTGDITGAGSGAFTTTLSNSGVTANTYGSSTAIPVLTVDAKGRITSASTVGIIAGVNTITYTSGTTYANGGAISGTTLTLAAADGSNPGLISTGSQTIAGAKIFSNDVTAPTFIGSLSGNATTATTAGNITATSNTTLKSLSNLNSVGTITSGTWSGSVIGSNVGGAGTVNGLLKANGSGVVSSAVSGTDYQAVLTAGSGISIASETISAIGLTSSNLASNAAILNSQLANSTTTLGSTTMTLGGTVTSVTGLTSVISSGFTGALTGNASTASKLAATKNINGVAFDGSADITVTTNAGTLIGTTLANNVVNSSLTRVGTITSGTWSATTIAISNGGTGGTSIIQARNNLGIPNPTISGQNNDQQQVLIGDVNSGELLYKDLYDINSSLFDDKASLSASQNYFTGDIKAKTYILTNPSSTTANTSTTNINLSTGNVLEVILSTNTTLTFSNPRIGTYIIKIKQDSTGGRLVTFPTIKWADDAVPTITATANRTDLVTIIYDGVDFYGSCLQNF